MGGKDTEVTAVTKNILLEAAVFNPIIIRRARQKLGLQSESSYRFERGIDLTNPERASWQAVEMMQELTGAVCLCSKAVGLSQPKKKTIQLNVSGVHALLGVNISAGKIKKILSSLGLKAQAKRTNCVSVEIPLHRQDVNSEIDLIEELARIYGYERIPKTLPQVAPQANINQKQELVVFIKEALVGLGLNEVASYSLIDKDWLKDLLPQGAPEPIAILNPLSKEQEVLRPLLLPSLLKCVAYNLNQKQSYVNIFEIAKVFAVAGSQAREELVLGIALCGTKEKAGFLHLKGILEVLFERLGIENYKFNTGNPAQIEVLAGEQKIAGLKQPQKTILESFEIKNKDVFVLELSLEKLFSYVNWQKKYVALPLYPAIARDTSLVLKEEIRAEDLLAAIKSKGGPLLREAKIIDYYKGKQIPPGFKSLTISCLYRSGERTLTEKEVNPLQTEVVKTLTEKFGAQIR